MKGKKVLIAVACGIIVFVGARSTTGREVVASGVKFTTGIDLSKNFDKDYIEEVNTESSNNGVSIKMDEVYRNGNELRVVYTMGFKKGVPKSLEYGDVYLNGINFNNSEDIKGSRGDVPVRACTPREVERTENTIKIELVMFLESFTLDKDLDISIKYKDIKDDWNTIKGEWAINHKVLADKGENQVKLTPFNEKLEYKISDGSVVKLDGYVNTNTGFKIYGTHTTLKNAENINIIRFEGKDNLGNKIMMYPKYPKYVKEGESQLIFSLYDKPPGMADDRLQLSDGVNSLNLRFYEDKCEFKDGNYTQTFIPLGGEIKVNIK